MSGPISINCKGGYKKTYNFFQRVLSKKHLSKLDKYGERGVDALWASTPRDTGATAIAWDYKIINDEERKTVTLQWINGNMTSNENIPPIAMLIQTGHLTTAGTWVPGYDYINPAIVPVMKELTEIVWEEVSR